MKISKNISLDNVEDYFAEALKNSDVLELPKVYPNKDLFEVASYLQLISTFIRRNNEYTLKLPVKKIPVLIKRDEEFENVVDFFREEVNYATTIMSWGKTIENLDSEKLERAYINNFTPIIRSEMNSLKGSSRKLQKGNILFLTCFDHFADAKGLLNSFYLDKKNFYDQKEFFFSPFIERLSFFSQSFNRNVAVKNLKSTFHDITDIIYELMLNTHEWARADGSFKELSPNLRGVYIKLHKGKIKNLKSKYSKSKSLETYLSNKFSEDTQGLSAFFEISVFDSGPGFIKRNKKGNKNTSIKDEVDIIKRCLTLHQTSASGHQSMVKGAGLDRISRILSQKNGFLKIRTARSSVYRDFISNPHIEVNDYTEICLSDWKTSKNIDFTECCEVEGATINIIYPFEY